MKKRKQALEAIKECFEMCDALEVKENGEQ